MSEPYEDLDPNLMRRAVRVFHEWARAQANPHRPFLESIGGSVVTPYDLLAEAPPGGEFAPLDRNIPVGQYVRWLRHGGRPEAWVEVLNLVAVAAREGDEYIDEVLEGVSAHRDAEGPAMGATE